MKATEIFNKRIITQNCDIEDSLKPEIYASLALHNDVLPFNYERLFVSGKLRSLLKEPKKVKSGDVQFRNKKDGGNYDGLWLLKGADFVLPLVFLHNALVVRLGKEAKETEVTILPGIRGDVVFDVDAKEGEIYLEELKSIYNLHFDLTRGYYKREVEKLPEEDCRKLLKEIEELDFTVAILQ